MTNQQDILDIYAAAIGAVQPSVLLKNELWIQETQLHISGQVMETGTIGRFILIAAGKAAPAMASEAERLLGSLLTEGVCVTKHHHSLEVGKIQTIVAGHPLPDENSIVAGKKVLELVSSLHSNDVVLVLLSGGASSLMADIPTGCTLAEVQDLFNRLVNSGASIHEINSVRKHLSKIKGGKLAKAAYPAKIFTLIISDVPGDDLSSIASGPTVPDHSTAEQAHEILVRYNIWDHMGDSIRKHISHRLQEGIGEKPLPEDLVFRNVFSKVIGNIRLALEAAREKAEKLGYESFVLNDQLDGDTDVAARKFVHDLLNYKSQRKVCVMMGGETTLEVTGKGKGGRNQHFALCALDELIKYRQDTKNRITILSAGTDGTDGPTDAAGGIVDSSGEIDMAGLRRSILNFDAYNFLDEINGLFKTGPTQTNVMDIVIAVLHPA